jgi:hypothetical protein
MLMAIQSAPADDAAGLERFTDHARDRGGPGPVSELISRVLRSAHDAAETLDAHDEARAILHVARFFADELAARNPDFDRVHFIEAATGL